MIEKRLVDIETKLAYQEDTLQELNRVIVNHEQRLERLETTLKLLIERLREVTATESTKPLDEKPPHY